MPGFITHLTLGEQSLSFISSEEIKALLKKHSTCYGLGLQGPDIFFYHIPAYICYKKNIGNVMHREKIMMFFESLFDAKNSFNDARKKAVCDAYIMGFIGHYSLDITCHPYIYFKSGHFNNLKKSGIYDFGRHVSLETDIDRAVLMHYNNILPSQFDYAAAVRPENEDIITIASLLHSAIAKTYPEYKIRFGTVINSINSFIRLNHKMCDPKGTKKKFIRNVEQIFFKCAVISSMIPSDTIVKYQDPCNENNAEWYNPWNSGIIRTESIFDLINETMPIFIERISLYAKACTQIFPRTTDVDSISETNDYLHYRNLLLASLSECSYITGLPL